MSSELVSREEKLPVHGFVLAGGKSSRMGTDKALLEFCGRPMVEIAVEKLRGFCAEVSIAGNQPELSAFGPVVRETRIGAGPAAGIEAGLMACTQPWAMFVPVDVPLVPGALLRRWAKQGVNGSRYYGGSYLRAQWVDQPIFSLLRRDKFGPMLKKIAQGERKLSVVLDDWEGPGRVLSENAEKFSPHPDPTPLEMEFWFSNVNTPAEFDLAEAWASDPAAPASE